MIRNDAPLKARIAALAGIIVGIVLTGLSLAAGLLMITLSIARAAG
jgi:hypothetical protein